MKKKETILLKELADLFFIIEKEFDLISFEIDNVKVWQYQRYRVFLRISMQLGLFDQAHTKKNNFLEVLWVAPTLIYNSIFSNPLIGKYQKETLVFSNGRKVKVGNKFIDIYTEYLINELQENSFEVIEELYLNKHYPNDNKNNKHQDFQIISTFLKSRLSTHKLNALQKEFISKIEKKIFELLGVRIDLKKIFRDGYLLFKYDFKFYDKLIKKRNPKKIFLSCSYGYKMALVAAAKHNNVEVVEIQHGTMNKYHLGYSYPHNSYIDYFPDKIYFFGEYWKNCMYFPLKEKNKIIYGFPHFQLQKNKYRDISKHTNQVLIISQGTIGKNLSEFIWESREVFSNYNVIYKLHPGEYDRWETEYTYLKELGKLENFAVIDNSDTNLYAFFARSEFVIGVYSTALYEALSFNCKLILANLSGVEYLDDLLSEDFAKLAKNKDDLEYFIKKGEFKKFNSDIFFA